LVKQHEVRGDADRLPVTVIAAQSQRAASLRRRGQTVRKGMGGGQVIVVDPREWVLLVQLPTELGHGVVQPPDDVEGLQVDDGPVLTRFGHAVKHALFENDGWSRGRCVFGRSDVVGDAAKNDLRLTLLVFLGDGTGAEVRCALLAVIAQDSPDGLMLFPGLRSDDLGEGGGDVGVRYESGERLGDVPLVSAQLRRDSVEVQQVVAAPDNVLTVVEPADDVVIGVADVPGVGMPRPAGPGGALIGSVTSWSVR
jgi:hypothetical protein